MPPKKPTGGKRVLPTADPPGKVEGSGAAAPDQSTASTPVATPVGTPSSTPAPASRSGSAVRPSPAVRGRGAAPKPKFAGRRSATARAEAEAAEAKKKEAEAKAAAEEAKRSAREAKKFGYNARGRGGARGGRGRGGHMGDAPRRQHQEPVASGPFSAGQTGPDQRTSGWNRSVGGGGGSATGAFGGGYVTGAASGSHSSSRPGASYTSGGMSIKSEYGGDVTMRGTGTARTDDGGYISSDEDEVQGIPRRDVDRMQVIDLTGDNEREEDPFVPVRLARVPHRDRAVGLVVEDSADSSDVAEVVSEKRRGKQRSKDIEVTRTQSIPKRPTAYSSSDSEGELPIKAEPTEDERQTRPKTPEPRPTEEATVISPSRDLPSSPESRRKAKEKIKSNADAAVGDDDSDFEIPPAPRFQTQAEKDEWDRQYADLRQIRREFGLQVPKNATQPDADGDAAMVEETPALRRAREQEEVRRNHVYLFQFPPVLPDLKAITIKDDPETAPAGTEGDAMDVDPPQTGLAAVTNPDAASKSTQPKLPSGQVGKLRVHKSGKTTLDWGGTSFVLGKGADATFLQSVLIAKVPETKPKENDKAPAADVDDAVGMGMGVVRGKFVLTPNWDEIL